MIVLVPVRYNLRVLREYLPFQTVSGRGASNPTVVAASPAAPPRCMRASLRCRSGDMIISLMEERWMSSVLRVIMEIRPSSSLVAVGIILACIDFKRCSAYTRVKYCVVDPQTADHRRTPLEVTNLSGTGTVARWSFLPAGQPPDMIFTELEVKDLFLLLRVFLRQEILLFP
jgi:hypothetical protein